MTKNNFKNLKRKVKARFNLGDLNLVPSENQDAFRESLKFYSTAKKYLQEHSPLNVSLIRHAQSLHPEKRNNSGATNATSNLSLKLTAVLENKLSVVFGTNDTKESICDMIGNQWVAYQN